CWPRTCTESECHRLLMKPSWLWTQSTPLTPRGRLRSQRSPRQPSPWPGSVQRTMEAAASPATSWRCVWLGRTRSGSDAPHSAHSAASPATSWRCAGPARTRSGPDAPHSAHS
ncbi:hypothetical protein Bbelb_334760, partial [Branchiostoma belcheri]